MKRKAYVAGQFYPGRKDELKRMIEKLINRQAEKEVARAVIAPHAGYLYSGPVAGAVFSSVVIPEFVIIIGPAHREIEPLFAIQTQGIWATPLGNAPIASDLADSILERCVLVKDDAKAHEKEHSLEVQVPFLQYLRSDLAIVPICVSAEAQLENLEVLGSALAEAIRGYGAEVLIVASTDMSHYVSQEEAKAKDSLAFEQILKMNPRGLFMTVLTEHISMCGFQPTTAALLAVKRLGAVKAEIILYRTSGDATGDYVQVVSYAGIRVQ